MTTHLSGSSNQSGQAQEQALPLCWTRGNDAASSTPTVSAPSVPPLLHEKVKEARNAVAWLFGSAARRDRAWICGWIGVEPEQLQAAVRREHGSALDVLLAKR